MENYQLTWRNCEELANRLDRSGFAMPNGASWISGVVRYLRLPTTDPEAAKFIRELAILARDRLTFDGGRLFDAQTRNGVPKWRWVNGWVTGLPPLLDDPAPKDDEWMPDDKAHFEFHADHPHENPHTLWYRTNRDVTVIGRGTSCLPDAWDCPTVKKRIKVNQLRSYMVRWDLDGYVGEVFEDELAAGPMHWRLTPVEKVTEERAAALPVRKAKPLPVVAQRELSPLLRDAYRLRDNPPRRSTIETREFRLNRELDRNGIECDRCDGYHLPDCCPEYDDLDEDGRPYCSGCGEYHWPEPVEACPERAQDWTVEAIRPTVETIRSPRISYQVPTAVSARTATVDTTTTNLIADWTNLDAPLTPREIGRLTPEDIRREIGRLTAEDIHRAWAESPDGDTF